MPNFVVRQVPTVDFSAEVHIDQEMTTDIAKQISRVKGVDKIQSHMRYSVVVIIGRAFDPETVLLNLQAELIKILP